MPGVTNVNGSGYGNHCPFFKASLFVAQSQGGVRARVGMEGGEGGLIKSDTFMVRMKMTIRLHAFQNI